MLSWTVKTETAVNTNQGPKWLLSEIKDVAISYTAKKVSLAVATYNERCNNALAVSLKNF